MSTAFEERERKDYEAIERVMHAARQAAEKSPELVEVAKEGGYTIIRVKDGGPGVHERKEHRPGYCLLPEL